MIITAPEEQTRKELQLRQTVTLNGREKEKNEQRRHAFFFRAPESVYQIQRTRGRIMSSTFCSTLPQCVYIDLVMQWVRQPGSLPPLQENDRNQSA